MFSSEAGIDPKFSIEKNIDTDKKTRWDIKMESEWEKRNEYCQKMKNKEWNSKYESKIKEWCFTAPHLN